MREIQHEPVLPPPASPENHPRKDDKLWLNLQYTDETKGSIRKPDELAIQMRQPPKQTNDQLFDRIAGSVFGMAIGDALGAHVEFRPRSYLEAHPVIDFAEVGTWGLKKGQVSHRLRNALMTSEVLAPSSPMTHRWRCVWRIHSSLPKVSICTINWSDTSGGIGTDTCPRRASVSTSAMPRNNRSTNLNSDKRNSQSNIRYHSIRWISCLTKRCLKNFQRTVVMLASLAMVL